MRRDPRNGIVRPIACNPNSRNRYNILAAVTVKGDKACEALLLESTADSHLFFAFVNHLIRIKFLIPGDIFVVDNCSIHMNWENRDLQELLQEKCNITMIGLPPYHPEFNPTEYVFNYVTQIMRSTAMRSTAFTTEEFEQKLINVLNTIPYSFVLKTYRKMGYCV